MRAEATQRESKILEPDELLPIRVERQLAVLLKREIDFHKKFEELKVLLKTAPHYTNRKAFCSVDSVSKGWWDIQSLKQFMKS